jgi:hypothetical protein
MTAFGPAEPPWTSLARHLYYERRTWLMDLETRITRTDSGLAWLGRVKRIGHA